MPKQIKKRIPKKEKPEEGLKSTIETYKSYYKEHKSEVNLVGWVVISIVIVIAALWAYNGYTGKEASMLNSQGYNTMAKLENPEVGNKEADTKKALEFFQKAYNKQKSPITLLYVADAYYKMGKADEAEKTLLELNRKYSENGYVLPLSYIKLIDIYRSSNQKDKALEAIKKLISLQSPIYKDYALYAWAQILKQNGQNDESAKKMEELEKNYPNSPYAMGKQSKIESKPVQTAPQGSPSPGTPATTSASPAAVSSSSPAATSVQATSKPAATETKNPEKGGKAKEKAKEKD
ncbi:MAG: tetratricopeptide repeat protein [Nitrospirae bacterium]|nr:tetratricopeptide repeat protein [Nitrospirota bacterium]